MPAIAEFTGDRDLGSRSRRSPPPTAQALALLASAEAPVAERPAIG